MLMLLSECGGDRSGRGGAAQKSPNISAVFLDKQHVDDRVEDCVGGCCQLDRFHGDLKLYMMTVSNDVINKELFLVILYRLMHDTIYIAHETTIYVLLQLCLLVVPLIDWLDRLYWEYLKYTTILYHHFRFMQYLAMNNIKHS